MNHFLSCDWGTSSFRLRWVDVSNLQFESLEANDMGIAQVFHLWKQSGRAEDVRLAFYLDVITDRIRELEKRVGKDFGPAPLMVSGMASSSMGMMELDYQLLPFSCTGADLKLMKIAAGDHIDRDIIMVPGLRTDNDAARGEETQLIGCDHDAGETRRFVFPGTHSKHILVESGQVSDITSFMTGEFFELLSEKSILSLSIEKGRGFAEETNRKAFETGVGESGRSNLLHTSFVVRINDLFRKLSKEENYYFLSGLLIGTELRDLLKIKGIPITVVASARIKESYALALDILLSSKRDLRFEDADVALVRGQWRVVNRQS